MEMYPVVSVRSGLYVAGCTVENNTGTLVKSLNNYALGEGLEGEVVFVGSPIPLNPSYSRAKDPERVMLGRLLAASLKVAPQSPWELALSGVTA